MEPTAPRKTPTTVFDFDDYRNFLRSVVDGRSRKKLSLRQWSKRLGYKSPRSLAMVIDGTRKPSAAMVETIAKDLRLSATGRRYFQLLVLQEASTARGRDGDSIAQELLALKTQVPRWTIMPPMIERYVSEWYMLVVKNLIAARTFKEDHRWIVDRLRGKVSVRDVRLAIETLVSLKIASRDSKGRLTPSPEKALTSTEDIPSQAIRSHHRQMIDRARDALTEQDVHQREFISLNLPVEVTRIPEIKTFIREFRDRFNVTFDAAGSADIGQLNLQFFLHTKTSPGTP